MLVASLLPLARPEGAFICLFWGLWILILPQRERARTSGNAVNGRERGVRAGTTGNVADPAVYRRVVCVVGVKNILSPRGFVSLVRAFFSNLGPPFFFHNCALSFG